MKDNNLLKHNKEIKSLTYETLDFLYGRTITYLFDFNKNMAVKIDKRPIRGENELVWVKTFTDEQKSKFFETISLTGLYELEDKYIQEGIMDGGGWDLTIKFTDGSIKNSYGTNAWPDEVFSRCAPVFYALCEDGVVYHWSPSKNG